MKTYKINHYVEDYYDNGDGKWITVYKSKTPISPEKFLELCKEYIVRDLSEFEDEDVTSTIRYEDIEQKENKVSFNVYTGDPNNPSVHDYDFYAEFEYIEPYQDDDKLGWCD